MLGAKPDDESSKKLGAAQTARPVWETAKDAIQYGSRGHGSGFFFTEKPDANVWVDGEVANYFRETYEEVKERLGETRALRLAGHNTMFPTLSWLNGTATLRVWHPRGPNKTEVWAFCICDADAPEDVQAAFERSATRAFGPAGFLEQDDSENWIEIQKFYVVTKHVKTNSLWKWVKATRKYVKMVSRVSLTIFSLKLQHVVCTAVGQIY